MHSDVLDDRFFATLAEVLTWMHGPRKDVLDVESGRLLTRVATASPEDAQESLMTVQAAQVVWTEMGFYGRAKVLARFSQIVWKYQNEMVALSQMLSGKSLIDAHEEFLDILSTAKNIKYSSRMLGKYRAGRGVLPGSRWRVYQRPLGIVGIFTSPDWPLSSINDVLQVIAAGNAVINFVTPQAALGAVLMHAMLVDAGMPYGLWKIIPDTTSKAGRAVIPGLDMVTVLGSEKLGRRISRVCQEYRVPFKGFLQVLNVGVICEDCRFDHAVRAMARAGFQHAGQTVNSAEVIWVQESIFDYFKLALKDFVSDQVTIGSLDSAETTLGSMLTPRRAQTIQELVDDAVQRGAELVLGGSTAPDLGPSFYEPTILARVPQDAMICERELHGPLIYLQPFQDLTEVSRFLGTSRHSYCIYLFTESEFMMRDFIQTANGAAVIINDSYMSLYSTWQAPIQGIRSTGSGIRHGLESILQYSRVQSVARQKGHPWISNDLQPGNRMERWSFFSSRAAVIASILFTDTVIAYAWRNLWHHIKNRVNGPV